MASSKRSTVPVSEVLLSPTASEFRGNLDLSGMMDRISSYSVDQSFKTPTFQICGFAGWFQIYPKCRSADKSPEKCIVFLALKIPPGWPNHMVSYVLGTVTTVRPASFFCADKTSGRFLNHLSLRKQAIVPVSVIIQKDMLISKPLLHCSRGLVTRLEDIHRLSKESGDYTLVLKEQENSNLGPPPTKKRKADPLMNQEIKICGPVLRSASPVFDGMLQSQMKEGSEKRIEIPAKSFKDIEDLAYFINTNKLKEDCTPLTLAPLAHLYQMHDLFWQCINTAVNQLSIGTFVDTVQLFNKYEIEERFGTVIDFGKTNVGLLKCRDDFKLLSHSCRFMLGATQSE